jgi:hypothetical protein
MPEAADNGMEQVTLSLIKLADVKPTDWAYESSAIAN